MRLRWNWILPALVVLMGCGDDDVFKPPLPPTGSTSIESVMANLIHSYEDRNFGEYEKLFDRDLFTFEVSEIDIGGPEPLPAYWGWELEGRSAANMFADSDVISIELASASRCASRKFVSVARLALIGATSVTSPDDLSHRNHDVLIAEVTPGPTPREPRPPPSTHCPPTQSNETQVEMSGSLHRELPGWLFCQNDLLQRVCNLGSLRSDGVFGTYAS